MIEKDYIIEKNLIERYVLGELNASEIDQVERALEHYSELTVNFELIEADLEKLGRENAIDAPAEIKSELLKLISSQEEASPDIVEVSKLKNYFWVAASIAALLLIGNIYFYSEKQSILENLETVEQEKLELNEKFNLINDSLNLINSRYALIGNPKTEKFILNGNQIKPDATIIAYVNTTQKKVLVDTQNLPKLDSEHDYQMWADVDGEMIDMGVLKINEELVTMTYINNAESLNVTIEPAGGNDHPTVANLISNVYLDSTP
ncbi:MAG: anti-sigma factor [Bacteroidota bacterium]